MKLPKMLEINAGWPKLKKVRKVRPLGISTPIVWSIEPAFGCNLKCGYCCNELISKSRYEKMNEATWRSAFTILNQISPTVRVDLCGYVGEPTLNEKLIDFLPIAREIAPYAQIQITTNGTMLQSGKVTYKGLLDAGANIIYTDQYGDHKAFEKLAEESGYPYAQYYGGQDPDFPTPWSWYGPHVKMIVLMEPPHLWPKSRIRAGLLGNWYGNLNWERGKRYGMKPLLEPIKRRCNQPFQFITVAASGCYLLCCQDGMQTTAGKFGNVSTGVEGFKRFWFGHEMQTVRRRLRNKDRAATPYACAKCNITFSRCDYKHWDEPSLSEHYEGDGRWGTITEPLLEEPPKLATQRVLIA